MEMSQFLLHAAFWGREIPAAPGAPALKFLSLGAGCPWCCLGAAEERKEQHGQGCVWNPGILEWFWSDLKPILFQPPCHGQGHFPPDRVAPSLVIASNFKEVLRNKSP